MIIADTGFWLALANRKDTYHARSLAYLKENSPVLITTWPVMTETCHLLLHRLNSSAVIQFLQSYQRGAFQVFENLNPESEQLLKLMKKYQDLPMDLADASLVILAEKLGSGLILSTDLRDFKTYKWKNHKPFKNLLLPEYK